MTTKLKSMRVTFAVTLLLLITVPAISQSASSIQSSALLEVKFTYCLEGCGSHIGRIYADGRVIDEGERYRRAKSGQLIKVSSRVETQLEPGELAELKNLVEQPDFLSAQPEYVLKIVQDNPDSVTVTYRREGQEKKITVANYLAGSNAEKEKLPPSLLTLIKSWRLFLILAAD